MQRKLDDVPAEVLTARAPYASWNRTEEAGGYTADLTDRREEAKAREETGGGGVGGGVSC